MKNNIIKFALLGFVLAINLLGSVKLIYSACYGDMCEFGSEYPFGCRQRGDSRCNDDSECCGGRCSSFGYCELVR